MVFASIVFIFASTSTCQIFLTSSKHFKKTHGEQWDVEKYTEMMSSEHFEYLVNFPLAGISLLLTGYVVLRQEIANKMAHTSRTVQYVQNWGGLTSSSILQPIVPSACLVKFLW